MVSFDPQVPLLAAMTASDAALLISGVLVLLVAIGLLIFCVLKEKPYRLILTLFPVAVIMIAFPQIKEADFFGTKIETKDVAAATADFAKNPSSPAAITKMNAQLELLRKYRATNPGKPLPGAVNLQSVVDALKNKPSLSSESKAVVEQAQQLLSQGK